MEQIDLIWVDGKSEVRPLTDFVFKGSLKYIYDLGSHVIGFANRCMEERWAGILDSYMNSRSLVGKYKQ